MDVGAWPRSEAATPPTDEPTCPWRPVPRRPSRPRAARDPIGHRRHARMRSTDLHRHNRRCARSRSSDRHRPNRRVVAIGGAGSTRHSKEESCALTSAQVLYSPGVLEFPGTVCGAGWVTLAKFIDGPAPRHDRGLASERCALAAVSLSPGRVAEPQPHPCGFDSNADAVARTLVGGVFTVAYRCHGQGAKPRVLLAASLGGPAWHAMSC